ncbi:CLUMA_CG004243, isoform A [Clunio marinus]|uniref:CLUMA_CG004243, isoform A n=1 Tax=Clunio marinus TaxID=568069 RepID=A0A1J1HRD9_9DIPT|nr:CLUMA_CG004243, isoform A [Clunio marinus]
MTRQCGPGWFQELSQRQINASNTLLSALNSDTKEEMLKCCRDSLQIIGLNPLPSKLQLLKGINYSRGNDLAFLRNLYDSVYNICTDGKSKVFPYNQRLLLSCICHLDMMTTLRELDRILPKSCNKKVKTEKIKKCCRRRFDTPYDEPVPKPKLQPQRIIFKQPRRFEAKFEIYKKYKDPSYVIPNEANRWFANESCSSIESKHIAKSVVCEAIEKVFKENVDKESQAKNLCAEHKNKISSFHQLLTKLLSRSDSERLEDILDDYEDDFERGIIYGVRLELLKAENELREVEDERESRIMFEAMVRKIVENAADLQFLHLCQNCEKCAIETCEVREINGSCLTNETSNESIKNEIKFFHRPTVVKPFEFDYEKILTTSFLNDCGPIKNSINSALEVDKHLTIDNAISKCVQDLWESELNSWNEKCRLENEEKSQRVVADCDKIGKNKKKIYDLLREGLALMKKNPKFVLASFPDVHRLPILREWILQRFGIRYDDKENEMRWIKNKDQRGKLELSGLVPKVDVPSYKFFGIKHSSVPLSLAIEKKKKRDEWIEYNNRKLAQNSIERNRLYWTTLEPFMCNTEAMRRIFYAYAASNEHEFQKIVMNKEFI